jgi:hypothetical protein
VFTEAMLTGCLKGRWTKGSLIRDVICIEGDPEQWTAGLDGSITYWWGKSEVTFDNTDRVVSYVNNNERPLKMEES